MGFKEVNKLHEAMNLKKKTLPNCVPQELIAIIGFTGYDQKQMKCKTIIAMAPNYIKKKS